jgi:hypothetical protein
MVRPNEGNAPDSTSENADEALGSGHRPSQRGGGGGEYYEVLNLDRHAIALHSSESTAEDITAHNTRSATPPLSETTTTTVPLNIVLFRARATCPIPSFRPGPNNPRASINLLEAINSSGKMYVSPGANGALRLAVSNWMTGLYTQSEGGVPRLNIEIGDETPSPKSMDDFEIVTRVLWDIMQPQASNFERVRT